MTRDYDWKVWRRGFSEGMRVIGKTTERAHSELSFIQ